MFEIAKEISSHTTISEVSRLPDRIGKVSEVNQLPDRLSSEHFKLTNEQRDTIQKETGWSEGITTNIHSISEYKVYQEANLKEAVVGEKISLIKSDIDWGKVDAMGRTNQERTHLGLAPLDNNGRPMELHHIGQHSDSPLAELTLEEHRGKGNDTILHNKTDKSEIDRQEFAKERQEYWKQRVGQSL